MLKIGQRNQLIVNEALPFGFYLEMPDVDNSAPHNKRKILLKTASKSPKIGDTMNVFVYTSPDGGLLASLKESLIHIGEFAPLTVSGASDHGYFADWGLDSDLYIPQSQCHGPLDVGLQYVVCLMLDKHNKLIGTSKIERFLNKNTQALQAKQAVKLLIYAESPMGFKAIVDGEYSGLMYKSELPRNLKIGEKLDAFVKQIRSDGKVDLSLHAQTPEARSSLEQKIIDDLLAHDGLSTLTDKSSPDEIFAHFKVSKGAYKKAIGKLYKDKKIKLSNNAIVLVKQP